MFLSSFYKLLIFSESLTFLGRLLNNLGELHLKLLVPISLFTLGSLSLWGSCECCIDTPNCAKFIKFVSQINGFFCVQCNICRVNCSLGGHQFIVFRATILKKLIEEMLFSTSRHINQHFSL